MKNLLLIFAFFSTIAAGAQVTNTINPTNPNSLLVPVLQGKTAKTITVANLTKLKVDVSTFTAALANSPNWNAAYSWGNHAGLYKPLSYVPAWSEITGKPTLFSGSYTDLTNKPTLFNGAYSSLTGIPSTFTPSAHTHDDRYYTEAETNALISGLGGSATNDTINVAYPLSVTDNGGTQTLSILKDLPDSSDVYAALALKADAAATTTALNGKAAAFTVGTGLQLTGNVLSATGGGSGSGLDDNAAILAHQAFGSTLKAQALFYTSPAEATGNASLVDGQARYTAVYLAKGQTLTGVQVMLNGGGTFTADNFNGAALYSFSGGTLTRVAISTNSGTHWTGSAGAIKNIPFTSTYVATAGAYVVELIYNNSAQTTAPSISARGFMGQNGYGLLSGSFYSSMINSPVTTPATTIQASNLSPNGIMAWVGIY